VTGVYNRSVRTLVLLVITLGACGGRPVPAPPPEPPVAHHEEAPPPPPAPTRADFPVGDSPRSLVVAAGAFVWTDSAGAIWTMPVSGGDPRQLSDQHGVGFMFHPVVSGGEVFVSGKRDIARVTLPEGHVTKLGLGLAEDPEEVIADGDAIYVTLFKRDNVLAIPRGGGAPRQLMTFKRGVLAVHGSTLYAVSYATGVLVAVPTAGGTVRTIAKGFVRPTALAADDTYAYVYTEKDQTIRRVELATRTQQVLATGLANSDDLVADGAWLYTVAWPNKVVRVAKDGARTEVLADDLKSPTHLVLDGDYIYVVSRDQNKIVRLPR
jgi:hypothetical protein